VFGLISDADYGSCVSTDKYGVYLWTAGLRYTVRGSMTDFVWATTVISGRNGQWKFITTPMHYRIFDANQPDFSSANEWCVNLWPKRWYKWNDVSCVETFCFVCEDRYAK